MLNLGIFVFGLAATGMVAVFTAITLRELRRLGAESDQRQAMRVQGSSHSPDGFRSVPSR